MTEIGVVEMANFSDKEAFSSGIAGPACIVLLMPEPCPEGLEPPTLGSEDHPAFRKTLPFGTCDFHIFHIFQVLGRVWYGFGTDNRRGHNPLHSCRMPSRVSLLPGECDPPTFDGPPQDFHSRTISPTATTSLGSLMKRLSNFGDVDQPVLVNADVHEGPESRDVRHYALQDHPLVQVGQVADPFGELGHAGIRRGSRPSNT